MRTINISANIYNGIISNIHPLVTTSHAISPTVTIASKAKNSVTLRCIDLSFWKFFSISACNFMNRPLSSALKSRFASPAINSSYFRICFSIYHHYTPQNLKNNLVFFSMHKIIPKHLCKSFYVLHNSLYSTILFLRYFIRLPDK